MNEKGSALTEALPALAALLVFVTGILLGVYLIFARAWMQYQSEQALYCLSEGRTEFICRRSLEKKLDAALMWGRLGSARLDSSTRGMNEYWNAEVRWKIGKYHLKVTKRLDTRRLVQSRALRW